MNGTPCAYTAAETTEQWKVRLGVPLVPSSGTVNTAALFISPFSWVSVVMCVIAAPEVNRISVGPPGNVEVAMAGGPGHQVIMAEHPAAIAPARFLVSPMGVGRSADAAEGDGSARPSGSI